MRAQADKIVSEIGEANMYEEEIARLKKVIEDQKQLVEEARQLQAQFKTLQEENRTVHTKMAA